MGAKNRHAGVDMKSFNWFEISLSILVYLFEFVCIFLVILLEPKQDMAIVVIIVS